jgi:hypothetical protein
MLVLTFADITRLCANLMMFARPSSLLPKSGRCDVTISATFGRPVEPGGSAAYSKQVMRFFRRSSSSFNLYGVVAHASLFF